MAAMFSKPKKPDTSTAERQLAITEKENKDLKDQNKARTRNSSSRSGGYARDTAYKGKLGGVSAGIDGLSTNLGAK